MCNCGPTPYGQYHERSLPRVAQPAGHTRHTRSQTRSQAIYAGSPSIGAKPGPWRGRPGNTLLAKLLSLVSTFLNAASSHDVVASRFSGAAGSTSCCNIHALEKCRLKMPCEGSLPLLSQFPLRRQETRAGGRKGKSFGGQGCHGVIRRTGRGFA